MDSTVIQEIANQLGMAVDQAGKFVAEQLPGYAAMKITMSGTYIAIETIVFVACLIALILSGKRFIKAFNDEYGDASCAVAIITGVIMCVALTMMIVMFCCFISDIRVFIGWSNYPEAMLIDMALKAVG